jgi:hypothetical protein
VGGGGFNNHNTTHNSGMWGNGGGGGVDGAVRVCRDGSTTPYTGPVMPDTLRTPASAIDDTTLLCTPVVGRADHLLPPGVTRRDGDAESVNNSTRHYRGDGSEDGSVRSSGPLDTTFMQHSDVRPSSHGADGSSLFHNNPHYHQDVSAMLDFTEDDDGCGMYQQLPGSPVIMRRFDGSAGWINIPKRWLSPLCDREIAQLRAIQTREAEMAAASALEVASASQDAEEGPFLSVGRSRSVADATATTVACSSVTFTRSSALVSSSSVSNVTTAVTAEPSNPNDSVAMMGVGRRFRGVGRRGKAGRRGERDETGDEEVFDPRRPPRLNMMPANEDCGSPHRPRQQRRRRCEPTDDVDDKINGGADMATSTSKPTAPLSFRGFATVAYIPTNSIGTPQINRMLSRVELRSTEPRKLGGSYKDKPILSDDDTMNGSAPLRRPRSSASTDRPDPALSARGNYFAFVDVGSEDDDEMAESDSGVLGASTNTVAARHLVFTEGHEEVETPQVLARRLQSDDDDAADRFTRALQLQGVDTAISRPLFEDDDEQEEPDSSPHPTGLARMSTLTSDDAPASRGSTQPPEESIGNAPRRSGGGRRSYEHL